MRRSDARQLLSFPPDGDLTAAVREVIRGSHQEGWITIDRVASLARMSVRTLQRRLADEGTFFAALVDEVRAELAAHMLENTDASLDEIARAVGYSATTNFIRAFRRWTGKTPSEFRQ
jgi:AraC-like DNA-binding protein